jgi:hypothetical protein
MLKVEEFDIKTGKLLTDYDPATGNQIPRTKDVAGSYLEDWLNRQPLRGDAARLSVAQFYDGVDEKDVANLIERGKELVFTSGKYGYFASPAMAKALLEDSPIYDRGAASAHNAVAYGSLIISDGVAQTKTASGKVKILLIDNINRSLGEQPLLDKDGQLVPGVDVEKLLDVMGDGTMLVPSRTMKDLLLPQEISEAIETGLNKAQIQPNPDLIQQLQNEYESQGQIRFSKVNLRAATAINNEIDFKTERTVLQFRAALTDIQGIAKGTAKTSKWAERLGVDAIISLDDVKGATIGGVFDLPGVIELNSDLWINRKDIARYGEQSVGAQVKYKLPNATAKEFNPKMLAQAKELADFACDPYALGQKVVEKVERQRQRLLFVDLPAGESDESEDLRSHEATALILKSDKYGQIVQLPSIARQLQKSLRSQWLKAATSGIEIPSAMAQHHAALKPWEVCNKDLPDGAIVAYYRSPFGNVGAAAIAINNLRAIEQADPESYNKDGVAYMPPWTAKNIAITDFDSDRNGYFVGFVAKDPHATIKGLRNKLKDISDPDLQYAAGRTEIERLIFAKKDLAPSDYPYAVGEFVKANRPENMPLPIPKDKKVLHPRLTGEHLSVSIGKAWCITAQNPVGKVANQSMILESLAQHITYTPEFKGKELFKKVVKTFKEIDPADIPTDKVLEANGLPALNLGTRIKSVINSDATHPKQGLEQTRSILEDYAKYPMAKNLQTAVDIAKSNKGIEQAFQDFSEKLTYQKHAMRRDIKQSDSYLNRPMKNNTLDPVGAIVKSINDIFKDLPPIQIDREDLNRGFRNFIPESHHPIELMKAEELSSKYREMSQRLTKVTERLKNKSHDLPDAQPTLILTSLDSKRKIEVINLCDANKLESVNFLKLDGMHRVFTIEQNEKSLEEDVPKYLLRDVGTKKVIGFINEKYLIDNHILDDVERSIEKSGQAEITGSVETIPPYLMQNDVDRLHHQLKTVLEYIKIEIKGKETQFASAFQHNSMGQNISVKILPRELSKNLGKVAQLELYGVTDLTSRQDVTIRFDNALVDDRITPMASLVAADSSYQPLGLISQTSSPIASGTIVKANLTPQLDPKIRLKILNKELGISPVGDNVEISPQAGKFLLERTDKGIVVYLLGDDNSSTLLGYLDKTSSRGAFKNSQILRESAEGTYQRAIYQGKNNTRKLTIDIQSLVDHLPVTSEKLVMKQQEDKSLVLISAPPQYHQAIAEFAKIEVPIVIIPEESLTLQAIENQDSKIYQPTRLELVNWYKVLKANDLDTKQILELGQQLKDSYMQEDFMKGKPSVEKLPDGYQSTLVSISLEDKKYLDSIIEPSRQEQINQPVRNPGGYSRS